LSLARELKRQSPDCQIVYIGHKGDNFDTFKDSGHDFDFMAFINAGKFRRYHGHGLLGVLAPRTLALNIRDFFRLPGSIWSAYKLMRKFKPDVIFSKGSFVAVPVGLAGRLRRVPIVTHDSDAAPGLANRIVGRWAKVHATGLPAHYYPYRNSTIEHVGIPIDERIKKVTPKLQRAVKKKLELPADSTVLLISGGGNGSLHLNELITSIAAELLKTRLSLYIIHVTGVKHEADVKKAYKSLPAAEQSRVITMGFSPDFYAYSAVADLIITRAGATTLAELAAAGKTCIVIPAPFLAGGHQLKNTAELEKHDAAVVLSNEADSDELLATINGLLANDARRFELAKNLYGMSKPQASLNLAKLILKTAAQKTK
jgi:UDP-N-acetylglucosamine--N-acetylmuramyl-(pentapeptide) pyrophosphoryl-undecaprenol N-acetylglucosamine transferase